MPIMTIILIVVMMLLMMLIMMRTATDGADVHADGDDNEHRWP